ARPGPVDGEQSTGRGERDERRLHVVAAPADVGDERVERLGRDVVALDVAARRDNRDATLGQRGHAHVAARLDAQGVEQGVPGQAAQPVPTRRYDATGVGDARRGDGP